MDSVMEDEIEGTLSVSHFKSAKEPLRCAFRCQMRKVSVKTNLVKCGRVVVHTFTPYFTKTPQYLLFPVEMGEYRSEDREQTTLYDLLEHVSQHYNK